MRKVLLYTVVFAMIAAAGLCARAQQVLPALPLPDDPSALPAFRPETVPKSSQVLLLSSAGPAPGTFLLSSAATVFTDVRTSLLDPSEDLPPQTAAQSTSQTTPAAPPAQTVKKPNVLAGEPLDANGNPIPLDRQQPHRILGFMPNFRTVSAGAAVHPPGWKYNFTVATHQATDYSTFLFLGLTSLFAEGTNSHPALGKGADGFYAYAWRGFLDKTDGTYLSAWLLPSLLHEDTRYYPLGSGHPIVIRELYIISRQGVARTYSGHQTPNIAGLGGKVLTQYISRFYYPSKSEGFSVLATKFGYSVMRDVIFSNIREFYPDLAAHYIRKHRTKAAGQAAADASTH